jgi:hypothetical protein
MEPGVGIAKIAVRNDRFLILICRLVYTVLRAAFGMALALVNLMAVFATKIAEASDIAGEMPLGNQTNSQTADSRCSRGSIA